MIWSVMAPSPGTGCETIKPGTSCARWLWVTSRSFTTRARTPSGAVGVCRICREAYPDPTQFDKKSPYHDPKSKKNDPRWSLVDVEFVEKFAAPISLVALKEDAALEGMLVTQKGSRLSVQPVDKGHFKRVLRMAGAKTTVR